MHNGSQRRSRLLKRLGLTKQESFLVTNITNVFYLTGFTGSAAWLLVSNDQQVLISDTRYESQLADECPELDSEIRNASTTALQTLARVVKTSRLQTLRYESASLSKMVFDQLESELAGLQLVSTTNEVEELRCIKDKTEIHAIRHAIRINERAFDVMRSQLRPDQSELEIAHNLENQMRLFGASGFAFEPIIAVGARAALPHGHPTGQTIGTHPVLLVDWGARVNHYVSDLTRVLVTAKIPQKLRKIYNVVLEAQLAAIETVRPGVELKQVDAAARQVIESAGYGKNFGHGTGHGLGIEVHESPSLSPIREGKLESGMIITIEPGIYLPGWGGVRIEDDILVTPTGFEVLSSLPKELDACVVDLT